MFTHRWGAIEAIDAHSIPLKYNKTDGWSRAPEPITTQAKVTAKATIGSKFLVKAKSTAAATTAIAENDASQSKDAAESPTATTALAIHVISIFPVIKVGVTPAITKQDIGIHEYDAKAATKKKEAR